MKFNRIIITIAIVILCSAGAMAMEISEIVFKSENLPDGWKMSKSFVAQQSQLKSYEKKLGVSPLKGLANQVFIVDNRCRLQVNFVQCRDEEHAKMVFEYFQEEYGNVNKIVRKENIVIEIMTYPEDKKIKEQVVKKISP